MKTSVVMTTYNGEKYIKEQLVSIMNQTIAPDEVVVVDDASNDATVHIIKEFIEKNKLNHWKFIENTKNLGFNLNFRKALSYSSNELVFLCDQDDIWKENKIESMKKVFQDYTSVYLLACSFDKIDSKGHVTKENCSVYKKRLNVLSKITLGELLKDNFAQGCCMAVRREVIKELENDTQNDLEHDWSLALIAALKDGCYFLNQPLIQYRIHLNNTIGFEEKDIHRMMKRTSNRVDTIKEELKRVVFVLQFHNNDFLITQKNYLQFRINCILKKSLIPLIKESFFGEYRKISNYHAILGDCISILIK